MITQSTVVSIPVYRAGAWIFEWLPPPPHSLVKVEDSRPAFSSSSANHELRDSENKKAPAKEMTKETTDLGPSSMYLVYNTVIRSLQLNPLHRQASGDCGRSFRIPEVAGTAAMSGSFRFLLYFPVRLYFPLVPFRFCGFVGGTRIFRKSLSTDEHKSSSWS